MLHRLISQNRKDEDIAFCIKVSIASWLNYIVGAVSSLIVDPKLAHHAYFPSRQYAPGSIWVVSALSLVVLGGTLSLMARSRPSNRLWLGIAPLWFVSLPTFYILRPEVPHNAFFVQITLCSILTAVAAWVRYHPMDTAYLTESAVLTQAKLERAKEEIAFWRSAFVYTLGGFLAILFSWLNTVVDLNKLITTEAREQFLMNLASSYRVISIGVWIIFGVLAEIATKTREAIRHLEMIRSPEPDKSAKP